MTNIVSRETITEDFYLLSMESGLVAPRAQINLPSKLPSYLGVPDVSFATTDKNIFQLHRETLPTTRLLECPKQRGEFRVINEVIVMNLVPSAATVADLPAQ